MMEAGLQLARWVHGGGIPSKVEVHQGIEKLPGAFFRMIDGTGRGKQLVQVAPIDDAIDPAPRAIGRLLRSPRFPAGPLLALLRRRPVPASP